MSVQGGDLRLYSWQDDVPELWGNHELVHCDILKSVANLEICEVLTVLLENESVVWDIVAILESSIDLVEDVSWHVVKVIVASLVHHPHLG